MHGLMDFNIAYMVPELFIGYEKRMLGSELILKM